MGSTNLKLDLDTERKLCDLLSDRCHASGFTLRDGATLPLNEQAPKEKPVIEGLKAKLGPYIDFETGGLKLYEFEYKGEKGTFSLKPGWDKGGPNIMLQFHMRF